MSRVRVLRVIARMNVGGPALQVVGLQRGLDSRGFESRLLAGSVGPDEEDYLQLRAPDVEAVRVPGLGRSVDPTDDLRALRFIAREIRRFRPHIVHTHTAKAGVLGRLAARWHRVPHTIHTFHGHLLHGYFGRVPTWGIRQVERVLARSTSRLLAVGSRVRDELLAAGIGRPEQFTVVPPGVSLPAAPLRVKARALLDLPPDALVLAYVARLTRIKRPDRMVALTARLQRDFPDLVVIVAGEGPLLNEMQAAARPLSPGMRFLGWRADIEVVYAAADVVVLTSDNEGMPVTLIEAALCGTPAVATDVGSTREVVLHRRTGLVTDTSVGAQETAVRELLLNPVLRIRYGQAAAKHAEHLFAASRLVADTEAVYGAVLRNGRAASPQPSRATKGWIA